MKEQGSSSSFFPSIRLISIFIFFSFFGTNADESERRLKDDWQFGNRKTDICCQYFVSVLFFSYLDFCKICGRQREICLPAFLDDKDLLGPASVSAEWHLKSARRPRYESRAEQRPTRHARLLPFLSFLSLPVFPLSYCLLLVTYILCYRRYIYYTVLVAFHWEISPELTNSLFRKKNRRELFTTKKMI